MSDQPQPKPKINEKALQQLSDDELANVRDLIGAETERRRQRFDIDRIKVGMSKEDRDAAVREIAHQFSR